MQMVKESREPNLIITTQQRTNSNSHLYRVDFNYFSFLSSRR